MELAKNSKGFDFDEEEHQTKSVVLFHGSQDDGIRVHSDDTTFPAHNSTPVDET